MVEDQDPRQTREPNVPFGIAADADLTKARQATPDRDDLRHRYAEALARWALMYPISAWALSQGPRAERLARNWGEVAAKFVMEVRDEDLQAWRERAETTERRLARVRDLHQPTEGMGFDCDEDDTPGSYGRIAQVCTSCGTPGEQGVRWPCPTLAALDAPQEA